MRLLLILACCALTPAAAATVTIETGDTVFIIRTYDHFGTATTEFIGEAGQLYQCVALDAHGRSLGIAEAASDAGEVSFEGLRAEQISSVTCRKSFN